jgi:PAS domain S-box-containing protein
MRQPMSQDTAQPGALDGSATGVYERLALEAAQMGTWDWDLTTDAVSWSPIHEALWGYAPGTFPGTAAAFLDRIHPEDRALIARTGEHALARREPFRATYRVVRPGGTVTWVESYGRHVVDAEGHATRIRGVAFDVTDRKHLEEAERAQRELAIVLAATTDLREGLRLCLDTALRYAGLDVGGVYLRDEATGALDLVVHDGLTEAFLAKASHYPPGSPNAAIVAANQPVYTRHGERHDMPSSVPAGETIRFIAAVPMTGAGGPVGCLNLASRTLDDVPRRVREGLEAMAATAASAIARLRSQAALREREELFATLASQAMDAVALVDAETARFVEFNTAAHEGLGYTREEFARLTVLDVQAHHSPAEIRANMERLTADGRFAFETRHRCKDGSARDVDVRGRNVRVRGRDYGAVVWTDVTDRKRATEALKQSEARLASLFRSSPVGVLVVDVRSGRIVEASDRFCSISGFSREEVVGVAAAEAPFWASAGDRDRMLAQLRSSERAEGIEAAVRRRTGEAQVLELWAEIVEIGGAPHMVVAGADITERKRVERALRESEESFRTLTDHAPEGIFVQHRGRFVYANAAMARLLGAGSAHDLLGRDVMESIAPEGRADVVRAVGEVDARRFAMPLEHDWVGLDGRRVPGEATAVPLRFHGLDAHIVFVRDRTAHRDAAAEQDKLREQLQQSQKMESIGRLAGGVAHDFNNLLMVQLGQCELLKDGLRDDDPLAEGLGEIEAAAQRAAALTRQLLAFSRRQPLKLETVDVNDLVQGLGKMLGRLIGEDVALSFHASPEAVTVKADPGQVEQVLVNLAVNARDAMPSGGRLTIEVAAIELDDAYARQHADVTPGRYVRIAVSDTGSGMDLATKQRIFEPFFTTKERGKGTGLGLATVYGIVKQSGGHIEVYSERGHGTTFKVYLPRTDAAAQRREPKPSGPARGRGELVLVVEDDLALRELVVRLLVTLGYTAVAAEGAGDAVLRIEEQGLRPDVVVTDVVMPGLNGRKLVERIRHTLPDVPAVYMSGYTENAIVHHGVLDDGVRLLQKPFSMADLAASVRVAIEARRSAGDAR